jgi:radical SAM superfamily enzyme YgiQ (UPF0313 family)
MNSIFHCHTYGVAELDITLIRPTNYDREGYPIRSVLAVIPSNTLAQIGAIVRADLARAPFFSGVGVKLQSFDEAVDTIPIDKIIRRSRRRRVKSIIMLTGVQTNQWPRAQDLAAKFLPHNIPVLVGGFHVSGMLAMIGQTPDLTAAMAKGIILVAGEVEGRLAEILEQIVRGQAKPLYNFLDHLPDLAGLPMPMIKQRSLRGFVQNMNTIDTGRGCPFKCDFCTIINVQGNSMRCRDPQQVVDFVRRSYDEAGVSFFFFTDDNIARNPRWRELFTGLIRLREEENIPFTFMMQSDLAARKIPPGDFFELAARAGCSQVFFGVESVNPDNLKSQSKFQNKVSEYKSLVDHCHAMGIACQAGYILGLPFDTPQSIIQDVAELQRIGFDSVSFYILTPLPGSRDHQKWYREGRPLESDFNLYDVTQVTMQPDRMSKAELWQAYCKAWEQFYSTEHLVNLLKVWQGNRRKYWERIFFWMWYLSAWRVEGLHPMSCGFWTIRRRRDRRPGYPLEAFIPFWWGEVKRAAVRLAGIAKLFLQFQDIWLRSRPKSKLETALNDLIAGKKQGLTDWRELKARELAALYRQLSDHLPGGKVPSLIRLWLRKHNPFLLGYSRAYINRIWQRWYAHIWNPLTWLEVWIYELVLGVRFIINLKSQGW